MRLDSLLDPEVLVFVVGGLIAIIAITGHYLNDYFKSRRETELKEKMLEQGRSADEIERILLAGKDKDLSAKKAHNSQEEG